MKIAQIREMKKNELEKFVEEKKALAVKLRFDIAGKQIKNNQQYKKVRQEVARALTVLKQMEI